MRAYVALFLSASAATAQQPLSAIDWLSESLSQPPNFVISPPSPHNVLPGSGIISSSLDLVSREAAGLLPPEITGFPSQLWGDMPADEVIQLLKNHAPNGTTELHSLYRNILLAQANPPIDARTEKSPLLTRIDLLISMGALDEAETLINLAGVNSPDIFAQWFDVAVLANRTRAVCAALVQSPDLSDDIATFVICLARGGDWNAAAITLSLSASIGDVTPAREELLIRFLDPEMFEGSDDPLLPEPLTAIDFALREALGLPRPTTLPLKFLSVDMGLNIPQRRRMEAAERLVRSAAIPTSLLFAAYRGGRPASSGGIWERSNAVQRLDRSLVGDDDEALAVAIQKAFDEFSAAALLPALAEQYADALAHRPRSAALSEIADIAQLLLLLEKTPISAWVDPEGVESPQMELARILASRIPVLGLSPYDDPLLNAVFAAFADEIPQLGTYARYQKLVDDGNIGAAILAASDLLSTGRDGDPANIHEGLYLLRQAGQDNAARRAATQILLIDTP